MTNLSQILFTGFGAAIIASVILAVKELLNKKLTAINRLNYFLILSSELLISAAFFWLVVNLKNQLIIAWLPISISLLSSLILVIATFLQLKSITIEDLSLSLPFLALTPLFLIPVELLFFNKLPTLYAFGGICLIVSGAFWLGLTQQQKKFVFRKGSWLAMIAAFLFAFGATLDKQGTLLSNPLSYLAWTHLFMGIIFLISLVLLSQKKFFTTPKQISLSLSLKKHWPLLIISGLALGFGAWLLFRAYVDILVNYAISLKRAGLLITIILGSIIFREKYLLKRMPGVLLMLGGAIIIILFG